MTKTEVICAFADGESFDPKALADALADPDGRELLIDLVALRQIVQPEVGIEAAVPLPARPQARWWIAAAAAVTLAMAGSYQVGRTLGVETQTESTAGAVSAAEQAPAPTLVIPAEATSGWREIKKGNE